MVICCCVVSLRTKNCCIRSTKFQAEVRDVRYDTTFKLLFGVEGAERRTIHFLNTVLETEGNEVISQVKFLDTARPSERNRSEHFDEKVECECVPLKGKRYIVEMKQARIPAHTNRWIYYSARELEKKVRHRNNEAAQALSEGDTHAKARRDPYRLLNPVKVVTILNFDVSKDEMQNDSDVVVHWEIRERTSNLVASRLLS